MCRLIVPLGDFELHGEITTAGAASVSSPALRRRLNAKGVERASFPDEHLRSAIAVSDNHGFR